MTSSLAESPACGTSDSAPLHPRLRIALVIDDLAIGGAERGLTEEAKGLTDRGHDCHVVVLKDDPGLDFSQDLRKWGATIHLVLGSGLLDLRRVAKLRRLFCSLQVDVVHTYLEYGNILGVLAAKLAGRPAVASMRSVYTLQTRFDRPKRLLQSLVLRWGADRVMVVAAAAREASTRNMGLPSDRVVVFPNSIDLGRVSRPDDEACAAKRRELGLSGDGPVLCVPARLDAIKGHRYLIAAAAQLRPRYPTARYLFIGLSSTGDDLEEQRLRAQAAELGVSDQILFLGERFDVVQIVAASDLFVLPSLMEGLSRALLEAMAVGTPVVATAVGGNADVLRMGNTGWGVPPEDPGALARAIDEALSSPEKRARMAADAQKLVKERFAVGSHVERLEALYYSLLGPAQRSGLAARRR